MQTSKHMYHASRYRARKRYYEKEENKEKKRLYMKEYEKRPEVIARKKKKLVNSESQKIYDLHEEWAIENGYRENDILNMENSERFINYERRKAETQ